MQMHTFTGKKITVPIKAFGAQNCDAHILFRKTFTTENAARVFAYISTDGYCKLYLNGLPVTFGPDDRPSDTPVCIAQNISDYLFEGENLLAVHAFKKASETCFIAFDIEADGKNICFSDSGILCRRHSGYSDISNGKQFDSGSAETDFCIPYYDDSDWDNALELGAMPPSKCVPELITTPIKPISVKKDGNRLVTDFGKEYNGSLFLAAKGNGTVRIYLCSNADGSNSSELFKWVLSGGDDMLDTPDIYRFRYAEIIFPAGAEPATDDIRLISVE